MGTKTWRSVTKCDVVLHKCDLRPFQVTPGQTNRRLRRQGRVHNARAPYLDKPMIDGSTKLLENGHSWWEVAKILHLTFRF